MIWLKFFLCWCIVVCFWRFCVVLFRGRRVKKKITGLWAPGRANLKHEIIKGFLPSDFLCKPNKYYFTLKNFLWFSEGWTGDLYLGTLTSIALQRAPSAHQNHNRRLSAEFLVWCFFKVSGHHFRITASPKLEVWYVCFTRWLIKNKSYRGAKPGLTKHCKQTFSQGDQWKKMLNDFVIF